MMLSKQMQKWGKPVAVTSEAIRLHRAGAIKEGKLPNSTRSHGAITVVEKLTGQKIATADNKLSELTIDLLNKIERRQKKEEEAAKKKAEQPALFTF